MLIMFLSAGVTVRLVLYKHQEVLSLMMLLTPPPFCARGQQL